MKEKTQDKTKTNQEEKKKERSRKCCAYSKAYKAALREGKSEAESRAEGKKVPTSGFGRYVPFWLMSSLVHLNDFCLFGVFNSCPREKLEI